jgi:hypothetical protein
LNTANGSTLLKIDTSFFTPSQAQQLADRLDVPLRPVTAPNRRLT